MVSTVSATPSPSPDQARPDQTMPDPVDVGGTSSTFFFLFDSYTIRPPTQSIVQDTLSSTGIIKLNLGKLILPNPKEGVEFTPDALASFSIGLHSSEENEQYAKLSRVPSPSLSFPLPWQPRLPPASRRCSIHA
ncbi:hypothetical protein M422DRAFT_272894 [Sphaerobolus stellatus SS14]|uniref:Uncharacterized protein n=1 Tax=Sphaerobolus stellatus (strain SS14) TaxID=990650 RepID=A0A0C9TAF2_SPHS4|nr:hypothetical protein M422DRAFT_272894 [Sphaerobolus stellatus SS14]